jgi:hypothetical protein
MLKQRVREWFAFLETKPDLVSFPAPFGGLYLVSYLDAILLFFFDYCGKFELNPHLLRRCPFHVYLNFCKRQTNVQPEVCHLWGRYLASGHAPLLMMETCQDIFLLVSSRTMSLLIMRY